MKKTFYALDNIGLNIQLLFKYFDRRNKSDNKSEKMLLNRKRRI